MAISTVRNRMHLQLSCVLRTNSGREHVIKRCIHTSLSCMAKIPDSVLPRYPSIIKNRGCVMSHVVPGFNLHHLGRTGYVMPWVIAKHYEATRMLGIEHHKSIMGEVFKGRIAFLITSNYHIHQDFYSHDYLYNPLLSELDVLHIGSSSILLKQSSVVSRNSAVQGDDCTSEVGSTSEDVDPTSGTLPGSPPLVTLFAKLVVGDAVTRKAAQISQEVRDTVTAEFPAGGKHLHMAAMEPLKKPPGGTYHVINHVPTWSEMDFYFHMNHSTYIKICHDAGSRCATDGKLSGFDRDVAFHGVREMNCLFLGETVVGDIMETIVWEDQGQDNTLNFIVTTENGTKDVFHCQMVFYPDVLDF